MSLVKSLESYVAKNNLSLEKRKLFNSFINQGFPTIKDEEWKLLTKDIFENAKANKWNYKK